MSAPENIPIDELESRIAELSATLSATMARWLTLVGEADARGAAVRWGFRSTAEWLAWHCAITVRAARDHVRVARRLRELPRVGTAFAAQELSYSKVRALARARAGADEEQLLELARNQSATRLEASVRGLRGAPSADVDVARRVHAQRTLEWWWDGDGALCLRGRFGADEGAALVEALETAAEALHAPPGSEEAPTGARPPLGARRADALTEMVLSGAPETHVVLHADLPALACEATGDEPRAGEVCALEDGPAVPSETARRLTCDAVAVTDGGRRRRVVSPALRLSLERRDRCCGFPGCVRRHGLHAHHVEHWVHGGATDRDNLVLLCRFHHRLVHEEGFGVRLVEDAPVFWRPDGTIVDELPEVRARAPDVAVAA